MALLPVPALTKFGTAGWLLWSGRGLEKPGWLGAAGGKDGGDPNFAVNCALAGEERAGAGFALCCRSWVPWGGHHTSSGIYLQTVGSWHRAAWHQRDPEAYNVNYHHVIKSP